MNNENKKLYIPFDLKIKNELWDGFGKEQVPELLIGVAISLVLGLITGFMLHIIIGIVVFVVGTFVTVAFINKQRLINLSLIDQIIIIVRHSREQQKFDYKYKDDFFGDM